MQSPQRWNRAIPGVLLIGALLLAVSQWPLRATDSRAPLPAQDAVAQTQAPPKTQPAPPKVDKPAKQAPDVIFVPTPQEVVDKMLELADLQEGEVLYDLGCGDGRIVVTAAKKYGVRAKGFDIDPARVKETQENIEKHGVQDLASVEQADIFELDLSEADVVTLYLLPRLNVQLIPQLEKLKPGTRIVSHDFDMKGVKPRTVLKITPANASRAHYIYLWTVPLQKEGAETAARPGQASAPRRTEKRRSITRQ